MRKNLFKDQEEMDRFNSGHQNDKDLMPSISQEQVDENQQKLATSFDKFLNEMDDNENQ